MLPTDSVYLLMFGSGLLGGFGHCIGMCGPLVFSCAVSRTDNALLPHLLFSAGRVTTYSIIGGIMGLTGSFVGVVKAIEKFQYGVMAAIGLLMVLMGLGIAGWLPLRRKSSEQDKTPTLFARMMNAFSEVRSIGTYFPMGLALGFIPCGLLYTAFIAAAGAGLQAGNQVKGLLQGMLMLFLFGLGTTPSLLLLGRIASLRNTLLRGKLYKALSCSCSEYQRYAQTLTWVDR